MTIIDELTAHLGTLTHTEQAPTRYGGSIVTLRVPAEAAMYLAVPGGEDEDELHVTLAFLGQADDVQPGDLGAWLNYFTALAALARRTAPLTLTVTGAGRFENADEGQDACYLSVNGDGLQALREEVMAQADACGLQPSRKHPVFRPHVTLAYVPGGDPHPDPAPPPMTMQIPHLELWIGGTRAMWPLGTLSKADQGGRAALPSPSPQAARELYAQLTGDLVACQRRDRQTRARVEQLAAHHHGASEGLGAAVRAPRGSALEDAFLDHAEEARIARTLGGLG